MINIKKRINDFLEIFRKKEFFITNYDTLNAYDIHFKVVNEDDLVRIKNVLINLNDAETINDNELNLLSKHALEFSNVDSVISEIKKIISEDYNQTYFEAINENWNFRYYLSDSDNNDMTLYVKNEIKKNSSVIYALLALRKFQKKYYLWNLLE